MLVFDDEKFRNVNLPISILCKHPILLASGDYVPCGHCSICNERIKKTWITRLNLEAKMHGAFFVTLTFDDEHINDTSYRQVQLLIKRLRKFNYKFKYFGCFERGDLNNRPHYHIIFFGTFPNLQDFSGKECYNNNGELLSNPSLSEYFSFYFWHNGFCKIEGLSETGRNSIPYVVGYVQKKRDISYLSRYYNSRCLNRRNFATLNKFSKTDFEFNLLVSEATNKHYSAGRVPFYFMSQGLGFDYVLMSMTKYGWKNDNNNTLVINGTNVPIPRAFLKKFPELRRDYAKDFNDKVPHYFAMFLKSKGLQIRDVISDFDLNYQVNPLILDEWHKWFTTYCSEYLNQKMFSDKINGKKDVNE